MIISVTKRKVLIIVLVNLGLNWVPTGLLVKVSISLLENIEHCKYTVCKVDKIGSPSSLYSTHNNGSIFKTG